LRLPEVPSNLTFGGLKRNNLFITNSAGEMYSIRLTFAGSSRR
jgi:gluconolactonase